MSSRDDYEPGPAAGAEVRKGEDKWTLVLVRGEYPPPAAMSAMFRAGV